MKAPRAALCLVLAVAPLALTSCSSNDDAPSASSFASNFVGYSMDSQSPKSPTELASWSDLAVSGRINEVIDGRTWARSEDDPGLSITITVVIDVGEVLAGELPEGSDGHVYVEIPSPGNTPAESYDRSAPKDDQVLLYLSELPNEIEDPILDPDSGRPKGQPLFQLVTPLGFLIASGDGVVRVIDSAKYDNVDLIEFVPESESFPVEPGHIDEPEVPAGNS